MWLERIIIVNYKSCKNITVEFSPNDPNVFIGINDCGKSTVLKAIGLLLNNRQPFNFPNDDKKKNDFSNARLPLIQLQEIFSTNNLPQIDYAENECIIIGKLIFEPDDLDDSKFDGYSPHMQWIIDNKTTDEIWVMRRFHELNQTIKDYIISKDFLENGTPLKLFNQSAKYLQSKISELGISKSSIQNENRTGRFKNAELVNAVYNRLTLSEYWVEYSIKDEKGLFPEYYYLDWQITLDQLQQFAKSAINTKINSYYDTAYRFAKRQAEKAQNIVNNELDSFTKQFAVDFPNISSIKSNIQFAIESKLTDILINKTNTDGDIHLDSQGEGVKRQIWFALIKWNALNSLDIDVSTKKFIWCFDEPETHLYPKAQRDFFELIKTVSRKNVQSIVSTHSTIFIDRADFMKIVKFELTNGYTSLSKCLSKSDIYQTLQIRNSDFLFYDKFLIVEGDTEEVLIPHLFKLHSGYSLHEKGIQLINLGGKDKRKQNHQILKQLLDDFNKHEENVIFLFDNDVKFELTPTELDKIKVYFLGKQDIEDSIPSNIWLELIRDANLPFIIEEDFIDKIKNEIDGEKKINKNQKFYPKLMSALKSMLQSDQFHLVDDSIPSKGKLSGQLLCKYISNNESISSQMITAFDSLLT